MARIKIYGFKKYEEQLENLSRSISEIEGKAIYEGAGLVADAVREGIDSIKTDGNSTWEKTRREKQNQGLKDGFGIAPLQDDNEFLNVKLGFNGYNSSVETKKFPNGQPNAMVARVFNSGTSVVTKQPFFDEAVRKMRKPAQEKMKEVFENEIDEIMKG